jgi:hypothetical protein
MPSTLDSLLQLVTPETAGQIGKMVGMDEQTVQQGFKTVGPILQQLLANKTSTPEGAAQVFETATKANESGGLGGLLGSLGGLAGAGGAGGAAGGTTGGTGDIGGLLTSVLGSGGAGGAGAGEGMVDQLIGAAKGPLTSFVKERTGMDVGPVLAVATPLLVGLLGKQAKEQNLDASGVANLLQTESREYAAQHPEEQALISGAIQAAEQAAPAAAQPAAAAAPEAAPAEAGAFSAEEIALLAKAPVQVGGVIMAASPSGGAGSAQEIAALAQAASDAVQAAPPNSLLSSLTDQVRQITRQIQSGEGVGELLGGQQAGTAGLEACRQVASLVEAKASPQDAAAYKAMLVDVANKVAQAAKEGGFLGIGGHQVSDAEQQALTAIGEALGTGGQSTSA